ncbi:hypothetical protein JYS44_00265 [Phycisphaeraceae bacterium AH-315-B13]|nr:hypothetical protein [Phycisphaeraceae bacterium AH-315-B13]
MPEENFNLPQRGFGSTRRTDRWWVQPLVVFCVLSTFGVYATWAAFQGEHYFSHANGEHYLSPFYSPLLYGTEHEPYWIAKGVPGWWPSFLPFSPAMLILIGPGLMRFTCYYYRGAYYKAFWMDPVSCSVGEPRKGYRGENSLPLIMQNIHRYVFYPAAAFVMVLLYDGYKSLWFLDEQGISHFGIGVGSVVLIMNALLLGGYTFGCHCARHQIGGYLNSLRGRPIRSKCYGCVSALNSRHMYWAWVSLVWVGLSDVYVRLLSMGYITDLRITF